MTLWWDLKLCLPVIRLRIGANPRPRSQPFLFGYGAISILPLRKVRVWRSSAQISVNPRWR